MCSDREARAWVLADVAEVALDLDIDPDAAMLAAEALAALRGCSLEVAALRIRDRLRQLVEEWNDAEDP